jgi:hypothetical protein
MIPTGIGSLPMAILATALGNSVLNQPHFVNQM